MIVISLKGGLGNQLFQYACGRALSLEKQTVLALDLSWFNSESAQLPFARREYLLDRLNISPKVEIYPNPEAGKIQKHFRIVNNPSGGFRNQFRRFVEKMKPEFLQWSYIQEEDPFTYNPNLFLNTRDNIYLDGYWQNEAYFASQRDLILQELAPLPQAQPADADIEQRIQQSNSVSIHIRRGDYMKSEKTQAFHGVLSERYYLSAISKISETIPDPKFFIFSDDPEWCRSQLALPIQVEVVSNKDRNAVDELFLMTKCKHHIIANSTFSWWAAWLNPYPQAVIIAPAQWLQVSPYNPACSHWIKINP